MAAVVTVSMGIATGFPSSCGGVSSLMRDADVALYRSKLSGRNRVHAAPDAPS